MKDAWGHIRAINGITEHLNTDGPDDVCTNIRLIQDFTNGGVLTDLEVVRHV